eukprot:13074741-Alexandrium_andersonii.AAC.1
MLRRSWLSIIRGGPLLKCAPAASARYQLARYGGATPAQWCLGRRTPLGDAVPPLADRGAREEHILPQAVAGRAFLEAEARA